MTILSAIELRTIAQARYPLAFGLVLDETYNVISDDSMPAFAEELRAELHRKYGDQWETYHDCENFGVEALALIGRKHYIARRSGAGSAQGAAFGLLGYRGKPGHVMLTRVRPDLTITEYEPQTRKDSPLTPEQCSNVFFYFFA